MDDEDPYERVVRPRPEERIRLVLGLRPGLSLPPINPALLLKYYQYLLLRLCLPCEARYSAENEPNVYPVTVTGLVDPRESPGDILMGLGCVTHVKNKTAVLPLLDIEVPEDSPNFAILEDYWYWLWNWRELHPDAAPGAGQRRTK